MAPPVVGGKYRLEGLIGEGSMGVVHAAEHVHLRRRLALKMLKAPRPLPAASVARFEREAQALARLRHPNVVEVTDFGLEDGAPYLAMECLEGPSLADVIGGEGRLEPPRVLPILESLAAAVDYAHAQGVLHRDLKPSNVMLSEAEGRTEVKVLDFGLAGFVESLADTSAGVPAEDERQPRMAPTGSLESGALVGTPAYVAPELIDGAPPSAASDVYSFAVMAYEALVGRLPFEGTIPEVLDAHRRREPPAPCSLGRPLPDGVWRWLQAGLAKEPSRRPARAGDLAAGLRRAWDHHALEAWHGRTRARRLALALATAGTAAALAGVLASSRPGRMIEGLSIDLRFAALPARAADPRLVLVTLDDASVSPGPSMADRADEFARGLEAALEHGAKGVAVDVLLPAKWRDSTAFAELLLRHPRQVVLAAMATPQGPTLGTDCVPPLVASALGPEETADLFGLVNLEEGADGVVRRVRLRYADRSGGYRPSWPAHTARLLAPEPGPPAVLVVDPRISQSSLRWMPWNDLAPMLRSRPEDLEGALVLLGGGTVAFGDDAHRIAGGRTVSGLVLQAMAIDSLVSGRAVREAPAWPFLSGAGLVAAWAAMALLARRPALAPLAVAGSLAILHGAASFLWLAAGRLLVPLLAPVGTLALTVGAAVAIRSARPVRAGGSSTRRSGNPRDKSIRRS